MENESVSKEEFKSGISFLSVSAIIYTMLIFIPTQLFITLMTGESGGVGAWFTLLIWIEIGKLSGVRISKQEAFMILTIAGTTIFFPLHQVYNVWYRQSAQAALFNIGPEIPTWSCPPLEARIFELRTFLHPSWAIPILLEFIITFAGNLLVMGLSILVREMYVEVEELPFPLQEIDCTAILTLTGRDVRPIRILSVFSVFSFIYGFIMYVIPFIYQAWTGIYLEVIPLPWVDLSRVIERVLPGAMLGIATNIGSLTGGIVLPLNIIVGLVIGSVGAYIIASALTVSLNIVDTNPIKPGVQGWWIPGMNISQMAQRFNLYFWAVLMIGLSLAAGFGPILRHPRTISRAFSNLLKTRQASRRKTDPWLPKIVFASLAVGLILYAIIPVFLVPNFFIQNGYWFIPLSLLLPLIQTIILGRMEGETGYASFPAGEIQNLAYITSGYPGVDIWFAPTSIGKEASGELLNLRVAQLTKTKSTSYWKMLWIFFPLSLTVGYLFMELFWRIAPIPSARYPGVNLRWPIDAVMQSLWIRGRVAGLLNPFNIAIAFAVGLAAYLVLDFMHSPVSYIAIVAGLGGLTPATVGMIIGVAIRMILRKAFGKEWIEENRFLVASGLLIGESIAVVIGISIAVVINSIWTSPY